MNFVSLRGKALPCSLSDALLHGLAADGGLLVPETWPVIDIDPAWAELDFKYFAAEILAPFFSTDALAPRLKEICAQAFTFPLPLKSLEGGISVFELFHGPTCAFKDFGARFLALCCQAIPDARAGQRLVLVATSGDTGGAVAAAFHDCTRIPVAILYPKGRISLRQEKQLTVWGERVRAFAVDGSFDDCQSLVKQALQSDWWSSRFQPISANSINLGRLLPQMAYFAYASLKYKQHHGGAADFIIPSGNMGNATAALWALKLGFPIRKVIFAHNANATVPNYFRNGIWQPQATLTTLANAMDVSDPSNFERVRGLFATVEDLKQVASAVSVTDKQILMTIKQAKTQWGEVFCPHTATAIFAGQQQTHANWVAVATAHPAKFESILEPLLGATIDVPPALQALLAKAGVSTPIAADLTSLQAAISN